MTDEDPIPYPHGIYRPPVPPATPEEVAEAIKRLREKHSIAFKRAKQRKERR